MCKFSHLVLAVGPSQQTQLTFVSFSSARVGRVAAVIPLLRVQPFLEVVAVVAVAAMRLSLKPVSLARLKPMQSARVPQVAQQARALVAATGRRVAIRPSAVLL